MSRAGLPLPRMAPGSPVARAAVAGLAMLAAAVLAVVVLSPRGETLEPAPVLASEYFETAEVERGRAYRGGQTLLMAAALAIHAAILLALALGRPAAARRLLAKLGSRPLLGAAAAGAAIAILVAIATIGPRLIAYQRAVEFGLSTQSLPSWLWDRGRSTAITAALAAAGAPLLIVLLRRWPRRWWIPGAALVTGWAIVVTWFAPVVLGPVFNRFEPLPAGSAARADVLDLAERAGVDVGEVLVVDASRRGTRESAYVGGLGSSKRVVLYDNLIANAPREEVRAIFAHELAHVANRDIPRGLAFVALVAPFGLLFVREMGGALARRAGAEPGGVPALPAYLLAIWLATFTLGVAGNQLSRQVEARADAYAVGLTGDPETMRDLQLRLARANVADPDPPALSRFLFRTHPTTLERLGIVRAYEQAAGSGRH